MWRYQAAERASIDPFSLQKTDDEIGQVIRPLHVDVMATLDLNDGQSTHDR
ncbi:hypothetical protein BURPS668_A1701 [Burkholderia pseudomallei 668]|nr:hypothetical protein BURPS668_A1701 [Burkholderia pseudomallei 668]